MRLVYIPNALFVPGGTAATVSNIAAHQLLFRLGIVSYLLASALWLFVRGQDFYFRPTPHAG